MKKLVQYGAYLLPTGEQAVFWGSTAENHGDSEQDGAEMGTLDCLMIDPEYRPLLQKVRVCNQSQAFALCAIQEGEWAGHYVIDKDGNVRRHVFTGKVRIEFLAADQTRLAVAEEAEITLNSPVLYVRLPVGQQLRFEAQTRVDEEVLFHIDTLVPRGDIFALLEGIDL